MKHSLIGLAVGVALTLAAVATARDDDDDKDVIAARKEVLEVLDAVKGGKDDKVLAAKAAAIHKKNIDLNYLMAVYKLKEKGGVGVGAKPDPKSGVEAKIIALQRTERGPSPASLR